MDIDVRKRTSASCPALWQSIALQNLAHEWFMVRRLHAMVLKGRTMDARVAIMFLLAAVFVSGGQTPAKAWDGFVTDTHCGTNCQRTSAMTPDRACVRLCVRKGSKYGLWYEDHVYALEPQSKASRFAAEKVHVEGYLSNDVITIKSINPISATPAVDRRR
jgi:hypothetical protein